MANKKLTPKAEEPSTETTPTPKETTTTKKKSNLVKVIFDEQAGVESDDIFLGVNGKHYQIQRGVEVEVPKEVLNVVNESVYTKMMYDKDGNVYFKDVPRISYRKV